MIHNLRLPAEWEPTESVLMAWPHAETDWAPMLHQVRVCYARIISAIAERAKVIVIGPEEPDTALFADGARTENISYIPLPTNDTWTRDYGPVTLVDKDGCRVFTDFKFNGWGLKFAADLDNLATSRLHGMGCLQGRLVNRLGFVLEGGSIENDGKGTILTTAPCLLSANRNGDLSRQQIEDRLKEYLCADRILWLDHGRLDGDDTDGHIDTLARLLPGDKIAYVSAPQTDSHYRQLALMRSELEALRTPQGCAYELVELPLPEALYDPADGTRLPATYANFLIVNGAVIMPVYGVASDSRAVEIMTQAMPGYDIVTVDCSALVRQHGSLHCATMQIPL